MGIFFLVYQTMAELNSGKIVKRLVKLTYNLKMFNLGKLLNDGMQKYRMCHIFEALFLFGTQIFSQD